MYLGEDPHGDRVLYDAAGNIHGGCDGTAPTPPLAQICGPAVRLVRGSLADGEVVPGERAREIPPTAGTLLLFDSVVLPHEVLPVTGARPRVACTGWFHETLPGVS